MEEESNKISGRRDHTRPEGSYKTRSREEGPYKTGGMRDNKRQNGEGSNMIERDHKIQNEGKEEDACEGRRKRGEEI